MTRIYAVVHHRDDDLALDQSLLALEAGCNGVFLISHGGHNAGLLPLAQRVQALRSGGHGLLVGVNLLGVEPSFAMRMAHFFGLDAVWLDAPGITGLGAGPAGQLLSYWHGMLPVTGRPDVFASVAFKYQPPEDRPEDAAMKARELGFIPTTSGPSTGVAPSLDKITAMSKATGGHLAIASGVSLDNVDSFGPLVSDILVATGVSIDEHHLDFGKLSAFVGKVRLLG